jgi:hypothetical protein
MPANRRRHANVVPLASIASWVLVAAFACSAGMYYVYCKNQLHATGEKIKKLERELSVLITQNTVVRSKIARLSSRTELQARLNDGTIKLIPIPELSIVRLETNPSRAGSDFRPVSNDHNSP